MYSNIYLFIKLLIIIYLFILLLLHKFEITRLIWTSIAKFS